MLIFAILLWFLLILLCVILAYFFLIPFFFGAPYEPSRRKALKSIVKLANPRPKDKIAELGSGDGRVCIKLAKRGALVDGYEINPFLIWLSRRKIKKLNLENKIKIYWKNFLKVNLGKYNKIVMFQFGTITGLLEKKFRKELKPKATIISHLWKLPGWKIKKKIRRVYLYENPGFG